MNNEQKNNGKKNSSEAATISEKAQYEVFKNGGLPRETIQQWLINDFKSIQSLCHEVTSDKGLLDLVTDHYYNKYKELHRKTETENALSTPD